jgi:hypothetical protein
LNSRTNDIFSKNGQLGYPFSVSALVIIETSNEIEEATKMKLLNRATPGDENFKDLESRFVEFGRKQVKKI